MIKIGVKGLAKFMTASAAGQRKVLRDYKFPNEEGTAQAAYYREARDFVAEYHRRGHPAEWIRDKATVLQTTASTLPRDFDTMPAVCSTMRLISHRRRMLFCPSGSSSSRLGKYGYRFSPTSTFARRIESDFSSWSSQKTPLTTRPSRSLVRSCSKPLSQPRSRPQVPMSCTSMLRVAQRTKVPESGRG